MARLSRPDAASTPANPNVTSDGIGTQQASAKANRTSAA